MLVITTSTVPVLFEITGFFLSILRVLLFLPRMHELLLNGGTPYERGVEVDPSISRRGMVSPKSYVDEMIQQLLYLFYNMLSFSPVSKHSLQPGFLLLVLILREREPSVRAGGIQNSQCSCFCNFQFLQVED